MKQVISITPEGSLHGLQVKQGKGVDLRQFGHADIRRATNIEWVEEDQRWQIAFLDKDGCVSCYLTREVWETAHGYPNAAYIAGPEGDVTMGFGLVYLFADYEDAVEAEVRCINAAKISGNKVSI